MFSESEGSIQEFSEEESAGSPASFSSPTISSFTSPSGNCSESILKDIQIVSSDPKVVEQILSNVCSGLIGTNNSSDGPNLASNSSDGPKVTNNSSDGPKVTNNSSSNGPKVAKNKNPKVSSHQSSSKVSPKVVKSVSSDSDSEFKKRMTVASGAPKSPARGSRSYSSLPSVGSHKSLPLVAGSRPSCSR